MLSNDRHRVFKSLESDEEVLERVRKTWAWFKPYSRGKELDDLLWDSFRVQRRLIERSIER